MTEKTGREDTSRIFLPVAFGVCFLTILIYEFLTPMLMDDLNYMNEVKKAGNFFDLFLQERQQYMGWTGRSVAHFILRVMMYLDLHIFGGGRFIFNIVAAIMFTTLTFLIYSNIQKKKTADITTYLLIVMLLWIYAISFDETVLWETGACNYLFTTTIILWFMTLFRKYTERAATENEKTGVSLVLKTLGMLALGIIAGWCNENTSGGCLLFVIILTIFFVKNGRKIRPWMISGILGNIIGLAFMVLAPGNVERAANREELHGGIVGMAARFLSITEMVREELFVLLAILIVLVVYISISGRKMKELIDVLVFAGLSIITVYSLVLTATPQPRALFGAGIFMIIAVVQAFQETEESIVVVRTIRLSAVYIMCLYMFFTYIAEGASLARIYREEQERYEYLEKVAETGAEDASAPMLRPQFESKYSAAYKSDITEEWYYWTNTMMADYYGFKTLLGVDRDEWTEY